MDLQNLFEWDILLQVRGLTAGRAAAILPAIVGLASLVIGWIALARLGSRVNTSQIMGVFSLVLGLVSIIFSVRHLLRATGGFGTGSGRLGAIVALVLGLLGMVLGGIAQARSKRMMRRMGKEVDLSSKHK